MLSPSKLVLNQNLNQITELEKNLKRVSENVKCISKTGLKCKTDMKLNKALLKKKKLEVLALIARSQAVLANMEVLIAENELEEMKSAKELRDEKKKCETNGQPNAKKSKIEGGQEPVDKSKKPRKQSKKSPETSPKDKKLESLSTLAPKENLAPSTLAQKKTNDKKNQYKSAPSYGKQLIILSRPPIRSNVTCNQIGYLPNTESLRNNKIENSIYNHAENIEQFAKTMSLATNESFQKRYQPLFNQQGFYNQNVTSGQMTDFNQNFTDCNQNKANVGNQNLNQNVTTYQMSDFNRNNMTVCNQNIANVTNCSSENNNCQIASFNQNIANDNRKGFYQNQTSICNQNNYVYQKNSAHDSAYQTNIANESEISQNFEKISTDSSENAYGNFLETTNQIFKDIMAKKGTMNIPIKIEKENIPDNNSENTLVIDIPSSIVY